MNKKQNDDLASRILASAKANTPPTWYTDSLGDQTRVLGPIAHEIELSRELERARQNVAKALGDLFIADELRDDMRRQYLGSGGNAALREVYASYMHSRRTASNALIVAKNVLAEVKTRIQREKKAKR